MTAVLVHGVPDTHHVWDGVRSHLQRTDVSALALPGLGGPLPQGFGATKEEYVDWIIARLEEEAEPVDLVGHDWGGILTARVASLRPDLVRTWAGGSSPVSPDYPWHPWAQIWQSPGDGEQWMADLDPASFAEQLEGLRMPPEIATQVAHRWDATYKDSVLRLYRSAVHVGAQWEPGLKGITSPTLIFWGAEDPSTPALFAQRLAEAVDGARVVLLDAWHWTPLQRPAEVAQALEVHWAGAPAH